MDLKKLHILWLTENYFPSPGGMAQSCDRIVHNLRQKGIHIDILHLSSRVKSIQIQATQQGQDVHWPLEEDSNHSLNLLWNYLEAHPKREQFSHLVAFGGTLPILAGPTYAAWLSIPLITLLRGNDFDTGIFSMRKKAILQDALLRSACICAVSQDKLERVQKLFPQLSVKYVPNGINLADWYCSHQDLEKAKNWRQNHVQSPRRVMGIFGQLKAKKGVLFFLDTIRKLGLSAQFHFLFIGDWLPNIADYLNEYAETFQYTKYDFMERYALIPYYAACDLIAIPSFYDGLPNVLMEAGGLGIPIIGSQVAGMKDILKDQETAFLFRAGDRDSCSQAIRRAYETDKIQLQSMGQKLQRIVSQELNYILETERYIKIFENTA